MVTLCLQVQLTGYADSQAGHLAQSNFSPRLGASATIIPSPLVGEG